MKIKTSVISGLIANETKHMTPIPTKKLLDDLYVVQDYFANIFLIKDGNKYIAIDAGISSANIEKELSRLGIDPRDVKADFLTHSDIDHVNGLAAFPEAQVYIPEAEVAMLGKFRITLTEDEFNHVNRLYSDFKPDDGQNIFGDSEFWPEEDVGIAQTANGGTVSFLKNNVSTDFKTVGDGEKLTLEQTQIEAVLINGHTKGLTSYVVNQKYLFVGDGMSIVDGEIRPFNQFLNMDEAQHRESILKVKDLGDYSHLFTQHYGYTDNIRKSFESWNS